jgi:GH24 family phage-related lysozyme (muramidase)
MPRGKAKIKVKETKRPYTRSKAMVIYKPPPDWIPAETKVIGPRKISPLVTGAIYTGIVGLVFVGIFAAGMLLFSKLENKPAISIASPTSTPALITATPIATPTITPIPLIVKVSDKGKEFIKALEGTSLTPYTDAAGYCTIGIGHVPEWKWCYGHSQITEKQALDFFDQDIANTETFLKKELKDIQLNQCQFDAMASFEFNVGPYTFRYSGVAIDIRLGKFDDVPYDLENYIYSAQNGNPLSGLLVRRKAEGLLFSDCDYGFQ